MLFIKFFIFGLGILIGILFLYLVIIIFFPVLKVKKQPIENATIPEDDLQIPPKCRSDIYFESKETTINGRLYLPEVISGPVPCVIMSNGFGGTQGMILEQYAVRYAKAGMAVLTYDFRYFGSSEGEPRQLFSIADQLDDLRAAIAFARSHIEIHPNKIALWGTSGAGGYGLVIAAEDKNIKCIVGQCPALDSKEDGKLALEREGIGFFLRLFMHAQRDKGRARFGLSPHKVPIVGRPGTRAVIAAPGAYEGYSRLVSKSFINEVCARVILTTHGHNPFDYAHKVECPVLLQICEQDNLISEKSYLKTAEVLGDKAEVIKYPVEHFEIYEGENFEKAVKDQISFFKRCFN